jgi:isocitrate/isopropylmalate dehydrogenase
MVFVLGPRPEYDRKAAFYKHVGRDKVNPMATILAGAEALKWLGDRHVDGRLVSAGERIEFAVQEVLRKGEELTYDLVGPQRAVSGSAVTEAVVRELTLELALGRR